MDGSFVIQNAMSAPKAAPDGKNSKLIAELGQIISATVTKKNDALASLVTPEGFRFETPADSIDGEVGDELRFEVLRTGKNSLKLRQIPKESPNIEARDAESRRSMSGLKSLLKKGGLYREHDATSEAEERDLQLKAMEAASKIKRKLRYVTNNANHSAMKELLASGVSLDKISLDILDTVMREIKAQPASQTTREELDAMIDRYMKENNIPAGETSERGQLVKSLAAQGLPPTEQNMRAMNTVLIKLRELGNQDDDSIAKLLKEEKPLTVENIYLARHTCARLPDGDRLTQENWLALENEVSRLFAREGIEKNDASLAAARLLIEREIPLTAANIDKTLFLRDLEAQIDTQKVLYQAAGRIKQDRVLADVGVYAADTLPEKYESVMADLPFITARHLAFLLKRDQTAQGAPDPTVADCCNTRRTMPPAAMRAGDDAGARRQDANEGPAADAYARLLDIRRKLTYEAVGRLIAKNVDISEMKLDEAVAELDALAADAAAEHTQNLRAMGAGATPENTAQMRELYTRLSDISPVTNNVFAALLARSIPFTIRAVHDTVSADRLRAGYEQFETVITPKHGDGFQKIREQIEPVLAANGLSSTADNVKAAGILIKNRLEVTPENITEVRLTDAKLSAIQSRLHPNIAAAMIKDRLNPLDMQVDEILGYIDGFNNEYGEGAGDRLAEHIRALDKAKTLTSAERETMIAVYRALNRISADDSVGLGLSLRHGHELTLKNLMDDARNFKRMSASARPDEIGIRRMLEDIPRKELDVCELNAMLLDKISEKATPGALKKVLDNGAEELALSEALELIEENETDTDNEDRLARMQAALDAATELSTESVGRLAYARMPVTVANMQALHMLESAGLGKMLDRLSRDISADEEYDDDAAALELPDSELAELKAGESVDGLLANLSERLAEIKDNAVTSSLLDELILVQNAVMVRRNLGREDTVSFPVRLRGGIADLNLFVLNEDAAGGDKLDLVVTLDTPHLGPVRVLARRTGEEVRLEVSADAPGSAAALRQNADALRECLADAGFHADEILFAEPRADAAPAEETGEHAPASLSAFEYRV